MILDPEGDDGDEDCFDIHPEAGNPLVFKYQSMKGKLGWNSEDAPKSCGFTVSTCKEGRYPLHLVRQCLQ